MASLHNLSGGSLRLWDSTIPLVWPITSFHACDSDEDQESMQAHGVTVMPCGKTITDAWQATRIKYIEQSEEAQIKSRKSPSLALRVT